jgi:hypothetical protein
MDTSAWSSVGSSDQERRQRNWSLFANYLKTRLVDHPDPDAYLSAASDFYLRGELPQAKQRQLLHLRAPHLFALHPSLSVDAAREIITLTEEVDHDLRGSFSVYYLYPKSYYTFFEREALDPAIGSIVIEAYYGRDYAEAATLRGFDPKQEAARVADQLVEELCNWWKQEVDCRWYPAVGLIPFLIGAFEYIDLNHFFNSDYFNGWLADNVNDTVLMEASSELNYFSSQVKKALSLSRASDEIKSFYLSR